MLADFIRYIEKEKLLATGARTMLAVSGGIDSVVMAWLFHQAGFPFGICHVNFHLRGEESERDMRFTEQLAAKFRVPFFLKEVDTVTFARKNKLSVQVAARELRYTWFDELLQGEGYDSVAVAHHLDDQAETFLINLARGTGIAGLHGILSRQGKIIRPMLFTGRAGIESFAAANQIEFVEDTSNSSIKYTRNRIRHRIIPQFQKLNPSFLEDIHHTIHRIREAEVIFRSAVDQQRQNIIVPDGKGVRIRVDALKTLQPLSIWLYELISGYGFNASTVTDIIESLENEPGREFFSPSYRLVRDREYLLIQPFSPSRLSSAPDPAPVIIHQGQASLGHPVRMDFQEIPADTAVISSDMNVAFLDRDRLQFPLHIRKWSRGDVFYPLGMKGKKKLSDFFIDQKLSIIQKENTWLLCSGRDIAWVIGMRIDDRFKVTPSTKRILKVSSSVEYPPF